MTATPAPSRPRLWVFNPGHEEALSIPPEKRYTLSKEIRWMRYELTSLLHLLASDGDLIYVPTSPDGGPAHLLRSTGEVLPSDYILPPSLSVTLWGQDAHILRELRECPLFARTTLLLPPLTPDYLRLSHRQSSYDLLSHLVHQLSYPQDLLPHWVTAGADRTETEQRLRAAITAIASRSFGSTKQLMVKRPYTSSGRGVFPLPLPIQPKHLEALIGSCMRCGSISIEPHLDVVDNWAIEYTRNAQGEISFFALSHFATHPSGRAYLGNHLSSPQELWQKLSSYVGENTLQQLIEVQRRWLERELVASEYIGYIGIDLLFYRDGEQLCLHPCVEINLRTTMGIVAHFAYERYVPTGCKGIFRLERNNDKRPTPKHIPLLTTTDSTHFSAYIELEE